MDDSASTVSEGSFRKYFSKRSTRSGYSDDAASVGSTRSARKLFSRRPRRRGNGDDDDASSVSSTSSFRSFLSRGRSSRKKTRNGAAASKTQGIENTPPGDVNDTNSSSRNDTLHANNLPAKGTLDNDDASVSSVRSLRKYFKERKARRVERKKGIPDRPEQYDESKAVNVKREEIKKNNDTLQMELPAIETSCVPVEVTVQTTDAIATETSEQVSPQTQADSPDAQTFTTEEPEEPSIQVETVVAPKDLVVDPYYEGNGSVMKPAICEGCAGCTIL